MRLMKLTEVSNQSFNRFLKDRADRLPQPRTGPDQFRLKGVGDAADEMNR